MIGPTFTGIGPTFTGKSTVLRGFLPVLTVWSVRSGLMPPGWADRRGFAENDETDRTVGR